MSVWVPRVSASSERLGVSSEPLGASSEHLGTSSEHLGASSEHLGASSERLGASSVLLGASSEQSTWAKYPNNLTDFQVSHRCPLANVHGPQIGMRQVSDFSGSCQCPF
jgi:hypothetical protein